MGLNPNMGISVFAGRRGSRDLTLGCMIWIFTKRDCWEYDGRPGGVSGLRVVLLFPCCRGGVGRSEVLLQQVQLSFSYRNKFVIVLPFGLLVNNNTFSKMCIVESLTGYTNDGFYEDQNAYVLIIIKSKTMKLMLVILNFNLLHNQNDGWTVP